MRKYAEMGAAAAAALGSWNTFGSRHLKETTRDSSSRTLTENHPAHGGY